MKLGRWMPLKSSVEEEAKFAPIVDFGSILVDWRERKLDHWSDYWRYLAALRTARFVLGHLE